MAASVIPPNLTAETAIEVLTLPYSTTQDVNFGGTTHTVWYKYITKKYEYNLGIDSRGDATNWDPVCELYKDYPPVFVKEMVNNGTAQTDIVGETTYYFKFRSNTGNRPDPCILTFGLVKGPNEFMPKGTVILINDDSPDYPGSFINNSGNVVGFRNGLVPGENGDVLKDGTLMLSDDYEDETVIYNPDMTVRIRLSMRSDKIGSDHNNTFYVFRSGDNTPTPGTITSISKTGTIINSWNTAINDRYVANITGSTDGRYIYFQPYGGATDWYIKRLDTTNGVISNFSTTLPPGATVLRFRTMFALEGTGARAGSDVLVHMFNTTSGYEIIEYDDLGVPTVVRSYVTVTDGDGNRLLRAYTSDNIMLWTDAPESEMGGPCFEYKMRWRKVSIDTGDAIEDFRSVVYEGGRTDMADGCTASKDFGHAFSCPAIVPPQDIPALPTSNPVPEASSGIYQVKRGKTDDTVFTSISPQTKLNVKIPDPFIKTSMIGS